MRRLLSTPDGQAAIFFTIFGAATAIGALQYTMGEPGRMGPGFFPFYLGILLAVIGIIVGVNAIRSQMTEMPSLELRAALLIPSAIAIGGALLDRTGLAPSIVGMTVVASFASRNRNWVIVGVIALVLTTFAYLIFIVGLGTRIPFARF